MSMFLSEVSVDFFRQALPMVGSTIGTVVGLKKGTPETKGAFGKLALYGGAGWLAGYALQYGILHLLEKRRGLPVDSVSPRLEEPPMSGIETREIVSPTTGQPQAITFSGQHQTAGANVQVGSGEMAQLPAPSEEPKRKFTVLAGGEDIFGGLGNG